VFTPYFFIFQRKQYHYNYFCYYYCDLQLPTYSIIFRCSLSYCCLFLTCSNNILNCLTTCFLCISGVDAVRKGPRYHIPLLLKDFFMGRHKGPDYQILGIESFLYIDSTDAVPIIGMLLLLGLLVQLLLFVSS
jgi:hypothetical protein